MIATKEHTLLLKDAQAVANAYITEIFGETYFAETGTEQDHGWDFRIQCQREDLPSCPMVGYLAINHDGRVQTLSDDKIQDMKESAEVYAAKERGEPFARDAKGYVLRYHARIKANTWTTNYIDHKVGARGGIFVPLAAPIWRFAVKDSLAGAADHTLDVIDVNAITGEVISLTKKQIEIIVGGLSAARRLRKQAATA